MSDLILYSIFSSVHADWQKEGQGVSQDLHSLSNEIGYEEGSNYQVPSPNESAWQNRPAWGSEFRVRSIRAELAVTSLLQSFCTCVATCSRDGFGLRSSVQWLQLAVLWWHCYSFPSDGDCSERGCIDLKLKQISDCFYRPTCRSSEGIMRGTEKNEVAC